eukprot:gene1544-8567_t
MPPPPGSDTAGRKDVLRERGARKGAPHKGDAAAGIAGGARATRGLTAAETAARESRGRKILVRAAVGFSMLGGFYLVLRAGPLAVCGLVVLIQTMMFRELVCVKYEAAQEERSMPLFRTLQWGWFAAAMVWSYSTTLAKLRKKAPRGTV